MPLHKDLSGTDLHVPGLHKTQHEDGGSDEISLTGLAGSPALGSSTTVVTQSPGDNSTKPASTAYVDTADALKANLASPTFTGTPAAPTAGAGTNTTQLATTAFVKAAVDAGLNGLSWKQAVRAASTANVTLASAVENGDTLDGVTLATGDRILLKNQSTGAENGIYTVNASGSPTRAVDADAGAELVNATCYVSEGTANADTAWVCTNNATPTLGSTALTFAQIGTGSTAALDDLTDVVITSPASNEILKYNGSNWVNGASSSAGKVIQVVNTQTGASATGTTVIPWDDTIPQNSEGDEYMTLSITPTSSSNKLKIDVVTHFVASAVPVEMAVALFQDSNASAIAVMGDSINHATAGQCSFFTHYMTAGTTSATTFKVRAGCNTTVTLTFNGSAGARKYGGVMASSITITEIVP